MKKIELEIAGEGISSRASIDGVTIGNIHSVHVSAVAGRITEVSLEYYQMGPDPIRVHGYLFECTDEESLVLAKYLHRMRREIREQASAV